MELWYLSLRGNKQQCPCIMVFGDYFQWNCDTSGSDVTNRNVSVLWYLEIIFSGIVMPQPQRKQTAMPLYYGFWRLFSVEWWYLSLRGYMQQCPCIKVFGVYIQWNSDTSGSEVTNSNAPVLWFLVFIFSGMMMPQHQKLQTAVLQIDGFWCLFSVEWWYLSLRGYKQQCPCILTTSVVLFCWQITTSLCTQDWKRVGSLQYLTC